MIKVVPLQKDDKVILFEDLQPGDYFVCGGNPSFLHIFMKCYDEENNYNAVCVGLTLDKNDKLYDKYVHPGCLTIFLSKDVVRKVNKFELHEIN